MYRHVLLCKIKREVCQFSLSSEMISLFLKISCIRLHSQSDRKTANFLVKQPYCSVACRTPSPDVEGQTLTHESQIATSPNCRLYRIHICITFPLISLFLVFLSPDMWSMIVCFALCHSLNVVLP